MDLNGDGHIDLISGSWPGELFFFKGGPGRTFAAPEMLKDKDGKIINIGGGIKEQPGGGIYIYGNAEFEQSKEGTFVKYHDQRLKSTPEKPISITGRASAVHAVDWDGDGDFDLLIGTFEGAVHLIPNEGTREVYAYGREKPLEAAGKAILVPGGDAGPFAADWDGDGKIDLLVGAGDGSVWFYRNIGTAKAPVLAAGEQLVPPGHAEYGPNAPKEPTRGVRAKICVADWNGDGKLDLLVGDFATQAPNLPEPTAEEKAQHDKLRKERDELQVKYSDYINKLYGQSRVKDKDEREKLEKEFKEVSSRFQEVYERLPREYENHGWVWLFLRQPADARAAQQ